MDIKPTPPAEPSFTVTMSVTEMAVITVALGKAYCEKGGSPYHPLSKALEEAGYTESDYERRARGFGLKVRDHTGKMVLV